MTRKRIKQFGITKRWTPLKYHAEQQRLWNSGVRFKVVPAGRRSGKSEFGKREGVKQAMTAKLPDMRLGFLAPTHAQAKRLFWDDLKLLIPSGFVSKYNETELTIKLVNGATLFVMGMDKPQRVKGPPLDWALVDEFADMKADAWDRDIRPALDTIDRLGGAWLIGVPAGRNHYFEKAEFAQDPRNKDWDFFTWFSADILPAKVIADAKADMPLRLYRQEYEGSFEDFGDRAYYDFQRAVHASEILTYDPNLPIIFCFDFNVSPGTAAICQEQMYVGDNPKVPKTETFTAVIGEVWIPKGSNTPMVCRKLMADWGKHEREIFLYGDATGGAKKSSQTSGSDWDIIRAFLRKKFPEQIKARYGRSNPAVKVRLNAMNSRIMNAEEKVRFLVDPVSAKHVMKDFEGVKVVAGSAGEIAKSSDSSLTHISDAIGYYVSEKFPLKTGIQSRSQELM